MICSIEGCDRPAFVRKWCQRHYGRWCRNGDPLAGGGDRAPAGEPARFFEEAMLLETDDCILWPYGKDKNGYGMLLLDGILTTVHRHACRRVHGDPPSPKLDAAHGPCNNSSCFNPRHLSWKTRSENHLDKRSDGTATMGSRNSNAKLREEDIPLIRAMLAGGMVQSQIAKRFHVSVTLISQIKTGKLWTHVDDV